MLLTIGRFNANLVRSLLQKILITGKAPVPVRFRRRMRFEAEAFTVADEIVLPDDTSFTLKRLAAGTDATSIYVANSNVFQESVLLPWTWFDSEVETANSKRRARMQRTISTVGESGA